MLAGGCVATQGTTSCKSTCQWYYAMVTLQPGFAGSAKMQDPHGFPVALTEDQQEAAGRPLS